jgi:hypothetical protein
MDGRIDDDVVPSPGRPLRTLVLLGTTAFVVLAVAVAGVVVLERRDGSQQTATPQERPVTEDTAVDRTEEVLGEVFSRPPETTTTSSTVAPATATTSTTARRSTPTTTAAPTTTTAPATTTTTRPMHAPPPVDLTVRAEGEVFVEQYFSPGAQERWDPNPDCGNLHDVYEVVVYDEDGNKVAVAELTNGTYERVEHPDGGTTTRCTYDYSADVPEAESYTFTLAEEWNHESVQDDETVTAEELREEGGPTLSINRRYCPEC